MAIILHRLIFTGCDQLKISTNDCRLLHERNGTEISKDVNIAKLADNTFILLKKGQSWNPPVTVRRKLPVEPKDPIDEIFPQGMYSYSDLLS